MKLSAETLQNLTYYVPVLFTWHCFFRYIFRAALIFLLLKFLCKYKSGHSLGEKLRHFLRLETFGCFVLGEIKDFFKNTILFWLLTKFCFFSDFSTTLCIIYLPATHFQHIIIMLVHIRQYRLTPPQDFYTLWQNH